MKRKGLNDLDQLIIDDIEIINKRVKYSPVKKPIEFSNGVRVDCLNRTSELDEKLTQDDHSFFNSKYFNDLVLKNNNF